jgi:hypothetical protein
MLEKKKVLGRLMTGRINLTGRGGDSGRNCLTII